MSDIKSHSLLDPDIFRFFSKIIATNNSVCWSINTFKNRGYSVLRFNKKVYRAHRLSWSLFNSSSIPEGMAVRHKCDNPGCVNPDHLELGTQAQNNEDKIKRGRCSHKNKTHCKHGHEFNEENTRYCKHGRRVCKKCVVIRMRKHRGKK